MEISLLERLSSGILVSILWNPANDSLTLLVKEGEYDGFTASVDKSSAKDAFEHPYCYLSRSDIETSRSRRREQLVSA